MFELGGDDMNAVTQLVVFIAILVVLKFLFGVPISIVGSLLLTVLVTLIFAGISGFSRRR